jgi:parallel beta-helix repeat protein
VKQFNPSYVEHDPIYIGSDSAFDSQATSEGWAGNGSESDPYIIRGYNITSDQSCIGIWSVDVYFRIEDCLLSSVSGLDATKKVDNGIYIGYSDNGRVINNTVIGKSGAGIWIWTASCNVTNNALIDCNLGVSVEQSSNCIVERNVFEGCSLYIKHFLASANIHQVNDNTVNGKPLGYFQSTIGSTIDASLYGQVILINCSGALVEDGRFNVSPSIVMSDSIGCEIANCSFSGVSQGWMNTLGLTVYASSGCTFDNNSFQNSGIFIEGESLGNWQHDFTNNFVNGKPLGYFYSQTGISIDADAYGQVVLANCVAVDVYNGTISNTSQSVVLGYCTDCEVSNLTAYYSGLGVYLEGSETCIVRDSNLYGNYAFGGIWFDESLQTHVTGTTVVNSSRGIYGYLSPGSQLTGNSIHNSTGMGLAIGGSAQSRIVGNTVSNTSEECVYVADSSECEFLDNSISGSTIDGLVFARSDYSNITDNSIHDNGGPGIHLSDSDFCAASGNRVYRNERAFAINGNVNCTLYYNDIYENGRGLYFAGAHNNSILYNKITFNTRGIQVEGPCQNNTIYGNVLAWNTFRNAEDGSSTTRWDDGVSLGNQWSDYSGTGTYTIPGTASNVDRFPLIVAPYVDSPANITYEEEITDRYIAWNAIAVLSDTYEIYINGLLNDSGAWDGWPITVLVDGLQVGLYNYTLVVTDLTDKSATDTVFVNVTEALVTTTTTVTTTTATTTTTTTTTGNGGEVLSPVAVAAAAGIGVLAILSMILVARRRSRAEGALPFDPRIKVLRGSEIVGGKYEYKVKIQNDSEYVINRVSVSIVSYPEDCMKLEGNRMKSISMIEPEGFRSPQFVFTPTKDCVKGQVQATVSYVDHENRLRTTQTEPYVIRSVCDLLKPLEKSVEEFELLLYEMAAKSGEHTVGRSPEAVFSEAREFLPERNFHMIEIVEDTSNGEFKGSIRGLAVGKYTGRKVAIRVFITGPIDGEEAQVLIEALSDDEAMLPITIEEIAEELKD